MTRLEKKPDWYTALTTLINDRRTTVFNPGTHDCGLWASDCVYAMTGVDLAAQFRGQYSSIEEGLQRLQEAGYADQVDVALKHLKEVPAMDAQSGDIVAISTDLGWAMGVTLGHIIYVVTPGQGGLGILTLPRVERTFRIRVKGEVDEME